MKQFSCILILITVLAFPVKSQISIKAVSLPVGESSFSGNSPSTTGFFLDPSVDISAPAISNLTIRAHAMIMKDFNAISPPANSNSYFATLYGFGIEMVDTQPFTSAITMEYGGGALMLKDKTYSDINSWSYGIDVTAGLRVNVYKTPTGGLFLGIGGGYGQTFSNTNPSYFALYGLVRYSFSE